MRLSGREANPVVGVMPEADTRPIRLGLAGNAYRMEISEAIDLATKLADAVQHYNQSKENHV